MDEQGRKVLADVLAKVAAERAALGFAPELPGIGAALPDGVSAPEHAPVPVQAARARCLWVWERRRWQPVAVGHNPEALAKLAELRMLRGRFAVVGKVGEVPPPPSKADRDARLLAVAHEEARRAEYVRRTRERHARDCRREERRIGARR